MDAIKSLPKLLQIRMAGTCSAAWAEIGHECVDPASGEWWWRELGRTETTHLERTTQSGRPIAGMVGDINERPKRFCLTDEGEDLLEVAKLWAASPALLAALRDLVARYEHDGIPNDSLPFVEAARAAISSATQRPSTEEIGDAS